MAAAGAASDSKGSRMRTDTGAFYRDVPLYIAHETRGAPLLITQEHGRGEPIGHSAGNARPEVLKTLDAMGPLHGSGIARRLEQLSEEALLVTWPAVPQSP
jgi:hypothetical protein